MAVFAALLLAGSAGIGVVSADPRDVDEHVRLETGTIMDFDGGGDYVALNMTTNGTLAFFGVVYGTEEHPNHVFLVSLYVKYLGGADVVDANGGHLGTYPIPVLSAHLQGLGFLVEFNDTGYFGPEGRIGGGNGLFDFTRSGSGIEDLNLTATEPVYKALDLKRAWQRSDIQEIATGAEHRKEWTFSLYAENLTYGAIWDNGMESPPGGPRPGTAADGVVERVEFTFHVGVDITETNVQVPWYRVTVGKDAEGIIDSQADGTRLYKGVGVDSSFKYDHLIEGWDFTAKSDSSRLMLETFVGFGTFVPDIVQRFINAQFGTGYLDTFTIAQLETHTGGAQEITTTDDLPPEADLVTKDSIEFRDPFRKTGEMSWVSDVEVDGRRDSMVFQVHASEADFDQRVPGDDGAFHGAVLVGGYIYPAGTTIFHDPTFTASAVIVDLPAGLGAAVVTVLIIAAVSILSVFVTLGAVAYSLRRRERFAPNFRTF